MSMSVLNDSSMINIVSKNSVCLFLFFASLPLAFLAAESPSSETWELITVEGEQLGSADMNVTSTHWLLGRGDKIRRFTPDEVLSVKHLFPLGFPMRFDSLTEKSSTKKNCRVTLSNGDSLMGHLVDLSETEITFLPSVLLVEESGRTVPAPQPLKIMLESVTQLEWSRLDGSFSALDSLSGRENNNLQQDQLTLSNGDKIRGELSGFSATTLTLETDSGPRDFLIQELTHLRFNPELVIVPKPESQKTLVRLQDGSRVSARSVMLVEFNAFLLKTELCGDWQVPLGSVDSFLSLTENRRPLSERTPQKVDYTPFLSKVPHWQIDANVLGTQMRMQTAGYLTGLGMHSRTEVQWLLEEGDASFLAEIGIDDVAKGTGSVVFEILTDQKSVYQSEIIRGDEKPKLVRIDLKGKKTLTLRVDFGDRGDVQDRANWGNALILKSADE
jgi:hypothetical protein